MRKKKQKKTYCRVAKAGPDAVAYIAVGVCSVSLLFFILKKNSFCFCLCLSFSLFCSEITSFISFTLFLSFFLSFLLSFFLSFIFFFGHYSIVFFFLRLLSFLLQFISPF